MYIALLYDIASPVLRWRIENENVYGSSQDVTAKLIMMLINGTDNTELVSRM